MFKNAAFQGSADFVSLLVGLITLPLVLRSLGQEGYAFWAVVGSVAACIPTVQFGLASAINRHIPMHLVNRDSEGIRKVASTSLGFVLFGAVVLVPVIVWLNSGGFVKRFQYPGIPAQTAHLTLLIGCLSAMVGLVLGPFLAVLSGYQRYDIIAGVRISTSVIKLLGILWLFNAHCSLLGFACFYYLLDTASYVLFAGMALHLMPARPFRLALFDWQLLKEMLAYAINTFLFVLGTVLFYRSSILVIGWVLTPRDVVHYSLISSLILLVVGIAESSLMTTKPAITTMHERKDPGVWALLLVTSRITGSFCATILVGVTLWGPLLISTWLSRDVHVGAVLCFLIALGYLARLSQYPSFITLVGMGKHRNLGLAVVVAAVVALGASIVTVRYVWPNVAAVATVNAFFMFLLSFWIVPALAAREFGKTFRAYVASTCQEGLRHALLPVCAALVLWGLGRALHLNQSTAFMMGNCLVVGVLWLLVALKDAERRHLLNKLSARFGVALWPAKNLGEIS